MDEVVLVARCDLCGEGDRAASVARVVVGIATNPATATTLCRPDLMVVDLCAEHRVAYETANDLAMAGRPLSRRHTAPGARVGRPATSGGGHAARAAAPTPCPVPGCASVVRRNNVSHHLISRHGWRVPRQPKRCPDCGLRVAEDAKYSMQTHRAGVHGYDYLAALVEANT